MSGERGKKMVTRSIMKIDDPKRKIEVSITLDDKGFKGDNAGALCRLTNDLNDTLRKYANAHEIRVVEFNRVLKKDVKKKDADKK